VTAAPLLGGCDATGPCVWMRERLRDGVCRHTPTGVYLGDFRLATCPYCRGRMTPVVLATWPWPRLRPVPQRAEPQADGAP